MARRGTWPGQVWGRPAVLPLPSGGQVHDVGRRPLTSRRRPGTSVTSLRCSSTPAPLPHPAQGRQQ